MESASKDSLIYKTCELVVQHFRNLLEAGLGGFNSRIFQHMLHWEYDFVGIGSSKEALGTSDFHPEHIVPCAVMIAEVKRLITEGNLSDSEIAKLLQKHWKIARITKEQAKYIDFQLGYKSSMPDGWSFEEGDTLARLKAANISIVADSNSGK